tara:strand:- start:883 stop:1062 length:180 start_codon:yes stop_codon:yes gene_type:complete
MTNAPFILELDMKERENVKLIIPKPKNMDDLEYQKNVKKLVKILEILDIRVTAKKHESN